MIKAKTVNNAKKTAQEKDSVIINKSKIMQPASNWIETLSSRTNDFKPPK